MNGLSLRYPTARTLAFGHPANSGGPSGPVAAIEVQKRRDERRGIVRYISRVSSYFASPRLVGVLSVRCPPMNQETVTYLTNIVIGFILAALATHYWASRR